MLKGATVVGVLALQGAFAEHFAILSRLASSKNIQPLLVRTPSDLAQCKALIIPGGESTTIALLARLAGLLEPLRAFVTEKPVWGTCAGAILLAESVEGAKKGGQELLGGVDIKVGRNGWGPQVESFEAALVVNGLKDSATPFKGVFIRAPVVLSITPSASRPPIKIIAQLPSSLVPIHSEPPEGVDSSNEPDPRTIVALRQGQHLVTTFHPELTKDDRFHEYFLRACVLGSE
ncbi:hypothetical protein BOTBODRAFT_38554 [Botryobasidium botryosum FD-172 SS1]|uniref:glutaminase n=1 Tax=Botryobasidium botryosum (strain FD-172 SS1) TaxID=930990 RepID=A0A067LZF4_BOTB1|nr:hypothetical protein BOTBODRAFT_38554 [Botryobasidium botryosum FD-172 SS1]